MRAAFRRKRASAMKNLPSMRGSRSWIRPFPLAAWRCRSSPKWPSSSSSAASPMRLGWCYGEVAELDVRSLQRRPDRSATSCRSTRGEVHLCYAITEENAGSDPGAIKTTAERHGDHYLINGEKWHVTSYNLANHMVVQAKGCKSGEHCLFFCPIDAPGVRGQAHAALRPYL